MNVDTTKIMISPVGGGGEQVAMFDVSEGCGKYISFILCL